MAGEDITVDQLRQLLRVQAELREQAESRWRRAQRSLVTLLETFAPEEVDRRLKNGQPLDSLGVEDLVPLISQQVNDRLRKMQAVRKETGKSEELQSLKSKIKSDQDEIEKLKAENQGLNENIKELQKERDGLKNQLSAQQQALALHPQPSNPHPEEQSQIQPHQNQNAPEPDWMIDLRKADTFERDATFLRVLGDTGIARRPVIETKVAEIFGIKRPGGSIQALMARLTGMKLIELFRPWEVDGAGAGGRFPDLVRLTDQGQLAYWLLTGNRPQLNEFEALIIRHVSPEHTYLNLQAADFLEHAGYRVDRNPPDIQLPDKGVFKPDMVLTDEHGATLFVEVERDAEKNLEQRQSKWRNFYQASGGHLYVVCENRNSMRNIRSEINYSLNGAPVSVSLTNLADLQSGKRGNSKEVWLEVRQKGKE